MPASMAVSIIFNASCGLVSNCRPVQYHQPVTTTNRSRDLARAANRRTDREGVRAVAVAMAEGPAAGLALVETLAATGALAGYHLLLATRADLLRRLDRRDEAAAAYRE